MIESPRGINKSGPDIVRFEVRKLSHDLCGGKPGCEQVDDVYDPDAQASNAGSSAAEIGRGGDPSKQGFELWVLGDHVVIVGQWRLADEAIISSQRPHRKRRCWA